MLCMIEGILNNPDLAVTRCLCKAEPTNPYSDPETRILSFPFSFDLFNLIIPCGIPAGSQCFDGWLAFN